MEGKGGVWCERREAQGSEVIMSGVIRTASCLAKAYIMVLMMLSWRVGERICECLGLCCKSVFLF